MSAWLAMAIVVLVGTLLPLQGLINARPVDWTRILGALLVLAGVLLVAAPWRSPPRADALQPSGSSLR